MVLLCRLQSGQSVIFEDTSVWQEETEPQERTWDLVWAATLHIPLFELNLNSESGLSEHFEKLSIVGLAQIRMLSFLNIWS